MKAYEKFYEGVIKRPADGLYVLDSIGKFNMHRFMSLLARMGIPQSVIHDDDNNQNEHAYINHLIQDSKHAVFTTAVRAIGGDMETMLCISKPISGHRKPQKRHRDHILNLKNLCFTFMRNLSTISVR